MSRWMWHFRLHWPLEDSVKSTGIKGSTCATVWHLLVRDTDTSDSCPMAVPVAVNCSIIVLQGPKKYSPIAGGGGAASPVQAHMRSHQIMSVMEVILKLWFPTPTTEENKSLLHLQCQSSHWQRCNIWQGSEPTESTYSKKMHFTFWPVR